MYTYKRTIKTPNSVEIEFYKSIRKIGKNYGGRGINRSLSSEKQKSANKIRNILKWERLIDCNFCENDYFCRFSAPFGTFDNEEKFLKHVGNWMKRIKRRCKKEGIEFKYIGFRECGKLGKNWHMHLILSEGVSKIAKECWYYKNGGVNFSPLYSNHEYKKLAEYIQKDVAGEKRIMASRNLKRPEVKVSKATRKQIRTLERGELIEPPKGYVLSRDEFVYRINDVTGASWYFKFRPVAFRGFKNGIDY